MQAIRTKYHGATNTRGSRISAKCEAKTIYVSFNHVLDTEGNHKAACIALKEIMNWAAPIRAYSAPMLGGYFEGCYYWVWSNEYLTTGDNHE